MPQSFSHLLRVRYAETDQMGVVYHARYLDWFEVGRTEMIRQCGISYRALEENNGLLLPVVDLNIQYRKPARYDDEIIIITRVAKVSSVRLEFQYEIHRQSDQELLITGTTSHVWVSREWKPVRLDKTAPELYQLLVRVAAPESGGEV
jgi:acyl-CoA thioester hydrolase